MSTSRTKNERVDIRLRGEQKESLLRASALQGLSLSEFMLMKSLEAADEVIHRHSVITLSPRDLERFASALDEDAAPNEALVRADKARRERRATR